MSISSLTISWVALANAAFVRNTTIMIPIDFLFTMASHKTRFPLGYFKNHLVFSNLDLFSRLEPLQQIYKKAYDESSFARYRALKRGMFWTRIRSSLNVARSWRFLCFQNASMILHKCHIQTFCHSVVKGCFMIRVRDQSHLGWKMMCFRYVWY